MTVWTEPTECALCGFMRRPGRVPSSGPGRVQGVAGSGGTTMIDRIAVWVLARLARFVEHLP